MTNKIRAKIENAQGLITDITTPSERATRDDETRSWYIEFDGWDDLYQFIKDADHSGPYGDGFFIIKALKDDPTGAIIYLEIYNYYIE